MKLTRIFLLVAVLATAGLCSARAVLAASETPLDFVHALAGSDYADIAVDYLNDLKKENRLPPDLADVWDLEMSKCLRKAANNAYKPEEKEELMKQSKEHLDLFLKEKPNHPEAVSAMAWWAGFITDKAMDYMRATKDPALLKEPDKGKAKKAQLMASAREAFQEAQPKFIQAADKFHEQLPKLHGKERDEMEGRWQETRFQGILCNYYIAQTYEDLKAPERLDILEKASKQFDEIFQMNRETVMGLFAHMWQGKVVLDQGNTELAKDIFDEVLANVPEPGGPNSRENRLLPGMDALYAQVQQFRFEITAKESLKTFVAEARLWIKNYKGLMGKTDGYQAISVQLAKTLLAGAEKITGSEKSKLQAEALKLLNDVARIPGPSQNEADFLRKGLTGGGSSGGDPNNFAGATGLAVDAALAGKWDEAIKWYKKASDLVKRLPRPDRRRAEESTQEDLGKVYRAKAHQQFLKNDLTGCLETLKILLTDYRNCSSAPAGAALAVNARWNQYLALLKKGDEEDREKASQQMEKMAKFAISNWPGKPEADDARMLLGLLYLNSNKIDDALKLFDQVNPKSDRYTRALYLSGQTYWNRYSRGDAKRDKKLVAADRQKALEAFTNCVDLLGKLAPSGQPMSKEYKDATLALAEILLEGNDGKKAATLFQQLVDDVGKSKPDQLDKQTLPIFLGAVRAYLLVNDLDKASKAGMVLMDLGPDTEAVNSELLKFAKLVDQERKKAEAAVIAAVGGAETEAAKDHLAAMKEMLGKLLTKLASREKVSAAGMVWVATTCSAIDLDDAAEKLCQRYLDRVKNDSEFAGKGGKQGETRVRTLLISILRSKGAFPDAYKQIQMIIKEHPRALEPKQEEIHILLDWGEKDPAKFSEAISKCDVLRRSMEKMKPKPPEYYQTSYFEASCIYNLAKRYDKQGNKRDSGEYAHLGQQLLKSVLYNNPSLDPELKAKYNKLVDQFDLLQGRKPAPAKKPGDKKKLGQGSGI